MTWMMMRPTRAGGEAPSVKLAEEAVIGELWHRSVWLRCDRGPVRPRS